MWRVACGHPPACAAPDRPGRHHRLGISCQPQILGLPHLHLRGHQARKRFHVQGRRGRVGEDSRNRGMPLHHRSLYHADQGLCPGQRALDGAAEQQDAGNPRRHFHRDAHLAGAEHQEGNSHLSGIVSQHGGSVDGISRGRAGIGHLHVSHHRLVSSHCNQGRILLGHTLLVGLLVVGPWRRGSLCVCIGSFRLLVAGRFRLLLVLDHQGGVRSRETRPQGLVSQKSAPQVQVLTKNPVLVLHISRKSTTFVPAIPSKDTPDL